MGEFSIKRYQIAKKLSLSMLCSMSILLSSCGESHTESVVSGTENTEMTQEVSQDTTQNVLSESESQTAPSESKENEETVMNTLREGYESSDELESAIVDSNSSEIGKEPVDMKIITEFTCPDNIIVHKEGVTYGNVETITYFSSTCNTDRKAKVLLPGNYDENKEYPVVFFLHGIFGDENSIIGDSNNKIKEIAANLAYDGRAKECIIVFPNIYASSDPDLKPAFNSKAVEPYDNFINDLKTDLLPYVEEHYPVIKERESRGLIGFSMGGLESLLIGLSCTDLFDSITAISPAPGLVPTKDWAMEHVGKWKEEEVVNKNPEFSPKLLMIVCGTNDSVVGKYPESYHDLLTNNNVEHIWYEVPNADHDFNAIRSGFYNFMLRF